MNAVYAQTHHVAAVWAHWMWPMAWQVTLLVLIVWSATRLMRKSSAAARHALWLLVFLRLILPPDLAVPWSAGTLAGRFAPALTGPYVIHVTPTGEISAETNAATSAQRRAETDGTATAVRTTPLSHPATPLMAIWAAAACVLFLALILQYRRYMRTSMQDATPANEALMTAVASQADSLGVSRPFAVLVSPHIRIPAVFGFGRSTILMPQSAMETLSSQQLGHMIRHELAHIQRHDVELGWLLSALVCAYWFHPAVWVAYLYVRREREMACDDAVLYSTKQEGKDYAATIVRMAESFDDRVPAGAGFLGMLELSDNLLQRIRSVLDGTRARRFTWQSALSVLLFMVVLVPMGPWNAGATTPNPPVTPEASVPVEHANAVPSVVASIPANHATEVDPALLRIEVTFDQDMAQGFSWTGGPPYYPKTTGSPQWTDKRTCILPVQLEAGKLYRVGINSSSYMNFRSATGAAARPLVIAFVTRGADPALMAALDPPSVVSLAPEDGAEGVDPALDRLSVTFDRQMAQGFSWTGGGEQYPETTGDPYWSIDGKTCILPVSLKPNRTYSLGLNSPRHNNFQNAYGIPLEPVMWQFSTKEK